MENSKKKYGSRKRNKGFIVVIVILLALVLILTGILLGVLTNNPKTLEETGNEVLATGEGPETEVAKTGLAHESAEDAEIDFEALKEENPDIFAWLYVPGTDIDCPVLQSEEADDYYESHNAYGERDEGGAVYTELANLRDMCDFNTVLHGKTGDGRESGIFKDLYLFGDPDYFAEHEKAYIYLEDNLLTYEIFAAYEREDTSLIRSYDFTGVAGCEAFIGDMYKARVMGKNIREGWEEGSGLSAYHFLITLTTREPSNPGRQFVVIGAMTGDAAGTIDREME